MTEMFQSKNGAFGHLKTAKKSTNTGVFGRYDLLYCPKFREVNFSFLPEIDQKCQNSTIFGLMLTLPLG